MIYYREGTRMMRAVQMKGPGGPDVLSVEDVCLPEPHEHQVLIRVHASAINRADTLQVC